ncbi:MAG TPA: BON domain-containing protein [Candidatus Sulfotelmatobacter sp.]|nr:BON domain-containing protein [Candidatus Sulfotelmatobacter sp.]
MTSNQACSKPTLRSRVVLAAIGTLTLCGAFVLVGCNQSQHPDEKDAVNNALTANNLGAVNVSQDRDKGVMTLKGDLESEAKKDQAQSVAKQAAPDYTIANEIGVRPPDNGEAKAVDSSLDSGIEDNYKAALKAHQTLDRQSISYKAKNGTLVLSGSVKTRAEKNEAGKLAKSIPNVKEVVNEIEVKS